MESLNTVMYRGGKFSLDFGLAKQNGAHTASE